MKAWIRQQFWIFMGYTDLPLNQHDMYVWWKKTSEAHQREHIESQERTQQWIQKYMQPLMTPSIADRRMNLAVTVLPYVGQMGHPEEAAIEALRYADALIKATNELQ